MRAESESVMQTTVTVDAKVKRGPESWAFIYTWLGFGLTIEAGFVGLFPFFPWTVIAYVILAAITVHLFINSGWFQNKLIGMKNDYEARAR